MSSEKTTNFNLHKWAGTDYVKRLEFNENFDEIDRVVGEHLAENAYFEVYATGTAKSVANDTITEADITTRIISGETDFNFGTIISNKINILKPGIYLINVESVAFASNSSGTRILYVNNSAKSIVPASNGYGTVLNAIFLLEVTSQTTLSIQVRQTSGGSLDLTNATVNIAKR
ncbi:hypothetical protein ACNQFZ_18580 [Schinkia sp. CFF1]